MNLNEVMSIANETILQVKGILKFGSGSIIEDILNSNSESLGRSDFARDLYAEEKKTGFSELKKIMLRAAAAEIAMGGNCHESASLVFAYLMQNTNNLKIQLFREKMDENPDDYHVFTRIIFDEGTIIIVDEWGSNPRAFILENDNNPKESVIIYEDITNNNSALYLQCIKTLKKGGSYKFKQQEESKNLITGINVYKTDDNLEFLASEKYIGKRLKRAYNDPGL